VVRWSLKSILKALPLLAVACSVERDMPERLEMPDTMSVIRAIEDEAVRDSLMDVMPGGEMARGDSAAAMELLERTR
jgi:hypothetical protein